MLCVGEWGTEEKGCTSGRVKGGIAIRSSGILPTHEEDLGKATGRKGVRE